MKQALFTVLFCLAFGLVFSQQQGDYRSDQAGSWIQPTTWQVFFNGAWRPLESGAAGPFRRVIPSSSSGTITIRNNVSLNRNITANQLIVGANGVMSIINGSKLTIQDDGINTPLQIDAQGTLLNGGTLDLQSQMTIKPCQVFGVMNSSNRVLTSNPGLIIFHPGSTYFHRNATGGNIPLATWDANSTCEIIGMTRNSSARPGNLAQQFGYFRWNTPNMRAKGFSLGGSLQNVVSDLTVVTTGSGTLRFGNTGPGINLVVGGDFVVQNGYVVFAQNHTTPSSITINGDLRIAGGTLSMGNNNVATNVFLNGNFLKTGGNLIRGTGSGIATIRFDGGVQTYSNNSNISTAIHFSVQSGSTLNLGTSFLTGTGSFTLLSGGTVNLGSTDAGGAIQLGTAGGNIRVSGTRTYQTGSTVVYNGLAAQFMGTGHPAPPHTTINNSNGVTLLSNVAFNGDLVLNGPFNTQTFTVSFGGESKTISGTNSVVFYDMVVNQTASTFLTLSTNVDIANSLDINSVTTIGAGTQRLRLLSTPTRTANVLDLDGGSITGSVIVQRHLPKAIVRNDFFHLASPVANSNLVDWDTEIPMSKAYRYNEPTRTYVEIPLNSSTPSGRGFTVLVGGPSVTMDSRGTLGQGIVEIDLTSQSPIVDGPDGWNLIGNPYPSAIAWDNVALPPGVFDAVYVWDNFGNSGQGTATDQLVSYVDGVGTPMGYVGVIAQGQGFWVKATANTTLSLTEAAKTPVTNSPLFRKGEISNVLRIVINGESGKDETVVRLREGATDKFDGQFDAYKYLANDFNISTLTTDNVKAVINAFGTSSCNNTIPVITEGSKSGSYTFDFVGIESFDPSIHISLLDQVEKTEIDIRKQSTYSFTVTDANLVSTPNRFLLSIAGNVSTVNTAITAKGETLCENDKVARVTLETSEPGIQYSVEWNGVKISDPKIGTGSSMELDVNTDLLAIGENNVTITAQGGSGCSMATLGVKPVITKIRIGNVTSVQEGEICEEGSTTLRVTGADPDGWYQWYESSDDVKAIAGEKDPEFITPSLSKSKTYYVAAVNALGCEGTRVPVKAIVSHSREQVTLTAQGTTLLSSAETGNQWYRDGNLLEGETSNILQASEPGLYTVSIVKGACASSASLEITDGEENVDVIRVFPNPTKDKLFVRVKTTNNNVTATMVNNQGFELSTKKLMGENEIKEAEFDLLPYASGVYNLRVFDGQKLVIKKIAKIK